MTDPEKRARLNEMRKEIETMYPDLHGSVVFEYKNGKYMEKGKMEIYFSTKPKETKNPL